MTIQRNFKIIYCDVCHKAVVFVEGGDKMNRKSLFLCPVCFNERFPNTHAIGKV